ncbi:acetyltransferase, partial [Cryobacterium sp. RTS3]|nr:acetyltransferase [Cryobacterium sp. RTS3]
MDWRCVIILGGVTIGEGAVLGAGAVVTHDIEPYGIAVGNPARVIRKRFDSDAQRHVHSTA